MYRPKAEQVRVRLDRPLTRTEQAQLTDMFSELGLGLTVTEKEISSSNFSDLSDNDFDILTYYLLDEFNHGNAETALQNAQGAARRGKISKLSGVEKESNGDGQGNVWSGTIEHRNNYSTYYEADKGTRKDGITDSGKRTNYHDFDGTPAYRTEGEGAIQGTSVTEKDLKSKIQKAYDKSEDAGFLSSPDLVLSAGPISEGYGTLGEEVDAIIDAAIAEEEGWTGKPWNGDRAALRKRAAEYIRGMFLAANKSKGSSKNKLDNAFKGTETHLDETLEKATDDVERDVLSEIYARAQDRRDKMTDEELKATGKRLSGVDEVKRRHTKASPTEILALEAYRNAPREGGKKHSEEAVRSRRAKLDAEREERRKRQEAEREAKEAKRKEEQERKAAERAEAKRNATNKRDEDAKAFLGKHGSVAEYLEKQRITNTDGTPFMHGGTPLTLAAYLRMKQSERKALAERYAADNRGESLTAAVKDLLTDANKALRYLGAKTGGKQASLTDKTQAGTLGNILEAERTARQERRIKDGMSEIGLDVEDGQAAETETETEAEAETEETEEAGTEAEEKGTEAETETETETETDEQEEQGDYEREQAEAEEEERAEREAEREHEDQLDELKRMEHLAEKEDYDMITPEEERELARLRKKHGFVKNDFSEDDGFDGAEFSIGENSAAGFRRTHRVATEAVLDLLEKAGLKPHMVSEEEAQRVLALLGQNVQMQRENANRSFNQFLQRYISGKTNVHQIWHANIDGVLRYLDNGKELSVRQAVLNKAAKKHNIDLNSLGDLIDKLSDPIAVFKSAREDVDGKVVLIDAKDNAGNPIVVAINMNGTQGGMEVNDVTSVHGRENVEDFVRWAERDLLEDGNREKFEALINSFPEYNSQGNLKPALQDLAAKIQEKSDIAKRKQIEAQIAYHGSGADFEAFDHSHMGEGEGAQAYGWGTYVTEVEGIGKTYAKQNTTRHNDALRALQHDVDAISGQLYRHRDGLKYNEEQLKRANDRRAEAELGYELFQEKAEELKKKYGEASPEYRNHLFYDIYTDEMKRAQRSVKNVEEDIQYRKEKIAELEKALKDKQAEIDKLPEKFPRHLYTVEIPDDTGENYLDWNKKYQDGELDALLDRIGDALAKQGIDLDKEHNGHASWNTWRERLRTEGEDWEPDTATGKEIYEKVSLMFGGSPYDVYMGKPREASRFLSKVGFTGIKYPADNLRGGREDGARNYVVFDENDLKIKHHARFLRTQTGTIYGWTSGGEIYLVESRLNPDTPLHEYTHLWDAACRRTNPELWRRGVELMKRTPLWDEVKNDPNYANLTTDDEIAGEAHARLSGRDGAALLDRMAEEAAEMDAMAMTERLGLVARLKKWMQDFWRWTRDTFAPWTKAEAAEVSLDDFVRMPLADLVRGVNPNEAGRSAEAEMQRQKNFWKYLTKVYLMIYLCKSYQT